MLAQMLIVAAVVAFCVVYAAWSLMPAGWRRRAAVRLLRLPVPPGVAARLRKQAAAPTGCGCNGCDRASPKIGASKGGPFTTPAPTVQPIHFQPRPKR